MVTSLSEGPETPKFFLMLLSLTLGVGGALGRWHHLKEQSHGSAPHLLYGGEQVASPLCAQVLSSLKWDEMILYTQNLVQPRRGAQLMAAFLPKMIPQEVGKALKGLE